MAKTQTQDVVLRISAIVGAIVVLTVVVVVGMGGSSASTQTSGTSTQTVASPASDPCETGSKQIVAKVCDDMRGSLYVMLNPDDSYAKKSLYLADRLRLWQKTFLSRRILSVSMISDSAPTDSSSSHWTGAFVRYEYE